MNHDDYSKMTDRQLLQELWTAAHGLDLRRHFPDTHSIVEDLRNRLRRIGDELKQRKIVD